MAFFLVDFAPHCWHNKRNSCSDGPFEAIDLSSSFIEPDRFEPESEAP
jgi:hypothetical protein